MKIRVRSAKLGKVRFTSHRDAARMWERALRRAELPVASTQGFTPRPKISFGLALPTCAESIAEYVDIELRGNVAAHEIDLDALPERLSEALPNGFDVLVAAEREPGTGSLQESVTSCTWQLWSSQLSAEHYVDACRLLESTELIIERERKGKRSADDVRPMILSLRYEPNTDGTERLVADLATTGRALRPSELAELAFPHIVAHDVRALRTHQFLDHDGSRREVLPLPSAVSAFTQVVHA